MRFTVMDRRSFINQNPFHNAGRCNSEVCECDEAGFLKNEQLKKIEPFHLAAITILAFITAAAIFSIITGDVKRAEILSEKNQNVIFCSPNINYEILNADHRPVDGNNGNSCPHQFGAVGILYLNNSNHKKNHVC
jgi:hypothetical protein